MFYTCPLAMITADSAQAIRLFDHFDRGVMPLTGGLLDQPNKLIEAFDIIRARRADNAAHDANMASRNPPYAH